MLIKIIKPRIELPDLFSSVVETRTTAKAFTPDIFLAAFSAVSFLVYESTCPESVTMPFLTATPICEALKKGSPLFAPLHLFEFEDHFS